MHRRRFLATATTLSVVSTAGCVDTVSKRVSRSSVSASEPKDDDEIESAGNFRYVIEEGTALDVLELEERRVSALQGHDLWLTLRTEHPTEVPDSVDASNLDPDPGEIQFVFNNEETPDSVQVEIGLVIMLYAAYIGNSGDHDDLHVTVVDGFDEVLYHYEVKRDWIDRYVDGPAQFVEVHKRAVETIEVEE